MVVVRKRQAQAARDQANHQKGPALAPAAVARLARAKRLSEDQAKAPEKRSKSASPQPAMNEEGFEIGEMESPAKATAEPKKARSSPEPTEPEPAPKKGRSSPVDEAPGASPVQFVAPPSAAPHSVSQPEPEPEPEPQSKPEPGSQLESALPVDDDDWLEQIEQQFGGNK